MKSFIEYLLETYDFKGAKHFRVNASFIDEHGEEKPLDHKIFNKTNSNEAKEYALKHFSDKYKGYKIHSVHELND